MNTKLECLHCSKVVVLETYLSKSKDGAEWGRFTSPFDAWFALVRDTNDQPMIVAACSESCMKALLNA